MPKRFSRVSAVLAIGLVLVAGDASAQFGFGFGGGGGGFGFGRGGGGGFGGFGGGRGGGFGGAGFGHGGGGGGFGGGQMGRGGGFGGGGQRGGGMFGGGMGGGRGGMGQGRGGMGQGGMGQGRGGMGQANRGGGQGRGMGQGGYGQAGRGTGGKGGRGPYASGGGQKQKPGTYAQRPPQNPPRPPYPGKPQRPTYPRPPVIVHFPPRPVFPILPPPVAVAPPVVPRNPTQAYQPPAGPPAIRPVFNPPPPPRQPTAAPPAAPPIVPAATEQGPFVPKEILVTTQAQATPQQIQAFESRLGLTPLASTRIELLGVDLRRYRVADSSSVGATLNGISGDPAIRIAQPNYTFDLTQGAGTPAVQAQPAPMQPAQAQPAEAQPPQAQAANAAANAQPQAPVQYAISAMKLDAAHQMSTGAGVLVAVIDSGIDETNPDIAGSVVDRFDAVGGTFEPQAHGTAMAGVIVAHQYLRGIAPQAGLLAIRAFATTGPGAKGNSYDIIRGLDFAASRGAQVVNMSFAGPRDALLAEALMAARTRGMIEIAAAGNAGPDSPPLYPAAEEGVIAITATDSQNALFARANRGTYVAAAAPGVDILAPSTGATMQMTSGTSVAAAEASGVVALLLQGRQNVSAEMVRQVLAQTSAPLPGQAGPGNVLIDASAALQAMPPETVAQQPQTAVRFAPQQQQQPTPAPAAAAAPGAGPAPASVPAQ